MTRWAVREGERVLVEAMAAGDRRDLAAHLDRHGIDPELAAHLRSGRALSPEHMTRVRTALSTTGGAESARWSPLFQSLGGDPFMDPDTPVVPLGGGPAI